jgi:hypothetical protein
LALEGIFVQLLLTAKRKSLTLALLRLELRLGLAEISFFKMLMAELLRLTEALSSLALRLEPEEIFDLSQLMGKPKLLI